MKANHTWVLIADAGRARVYETLGLGKGLKAVEGLALANDLPRSHEVETGTSKPGRGQAAGGVGRHALEPTSDPHRQFKRQFAEQIAALLEGKLKAGAFQKLVVVAPPVMLGDLRDALSPHVKQAIKAEIDKDLTKIPESELAAHLKDFAPV